MADKIKSTSKFEVEITLTLTEVEARALQQLTVYGADSFLEVFYKSLGKSYLSPHDTGIRSLFHTIKKELPGHLHKVDMIRSIWSGEKIAHKIMSAKSTE